MGEQVRWKPSHAQFGIHGRTLWADFKVRIVRLHCLASFFSESLQGRRLLRFGADLHQRREVEEVLSFRRQHGTGVDPACLRCR